MVRDCVMCSLSTNAVECMESEQGLHGAPVGNLMKIAVSTAISFRKVF